MRFLFTMFNNPPDLLTKKTSAKLVSFKDDQSQSAATVNAKPKVLLAANAAPS